MTPYRTVATMQPHKAWATVFSRIPFQLEPIINQTTVWGGDWNQALEGRDYVGTAAGRAGITELLDARQLSVPTTWFAGVTPDINRSTTSRFRRPGMYSTRIGSRRTCKGADRPITTPTPFRSKTDTVSPVEDPTGPVAAR